MKLIFDKRLDQVCEVYEPGEACHLKATRGLGKPTPIILNSSDGTSSIIVSAMSLDADMTVAISNTTFSGSGSSKMGHFKIDCYSSSGVWVHPFDTAVAPYNFSCTLICEMKSEDWGPVANTPSTFVMTAYNTSNPMGVVMTGNYKEGGVIMDRTTGSVHAANKPLLAFKGLPKRIAFGPICPMSAANRNSYTISSSNYFNANYPAALISYMMDASGTPVDGVDGLCSPAGPAVSSRDAFNVIYQYSGGPAFYCVDLNTGGWLSGFQMGMYGVHFGSPVPTLAHWMRTQNGQWTNINYVTPNVAYTAGGVAYRKTWGVPQILTECYWIARS